MNPKPWQISTLVLATLTLLIWSEMKVSVSFGVLESRSPTPSRKELSQALSNISAQVSQNRSATSSASTSTSPIPTIPRIDFAKELKVPEFDKTGSPKTTITDLLQTEEALKINETFIPKEGFKTPYGLSLGLDTYKEMISWNKEVSLSGDPEVRAEKIINSTFHPCCGSIINTKVCGCGHAVGMSGLVKKMVQDGRPDQEIEKELLVWAKYFWPRHYVLMAMFQQRLGRSLDEINLGQAYSSVSAQKPVVEYLTYN